MANGSTNDYSGHTGNNFRPETIVIINCVLNVPLMLISIIGNTLVLAAILRTPSLLSPSAILLCSLAVSDLLVGFVVQPLYIAAELTEDAVMYQALAVMSYAACGVSLMTMAAISVDRFLALHYHMRYPSLMNTHRAIYTSLTLWLFSFILALSSIWNATASYFGAATNIVICLSVSTVCYTRIYRIAMQSFDAENIQDMERSKRSAINTFVFYIVLILCYFPLFVAMVMLGIYQVHSTNAWNLADTVAFMNSSINPILYCWRLRELRAAVTKTVKRMLRKETEEN
ncbi:melanocyte-stimulating hormone receptor-like isoform X2 [Oculina patagonica]